MRRPVPSRACVIRAQNCGLHRHTCHHGRWCRVDNVTVQPAPDPPPHQETKQGTLNHFTITLALGTGVPPLVSSQPQPPHRASRDFWLHSNTGFPSRVFTWLWRSHSHTVNAALEAKSGGCSANISLRTHTHSEHCNRTAWTTVSTTRTSGRARTGSGLRTRRRGTSVRKRRRMQRHRVCWPPSVPSGTWLPFCGARSR